MPETPQNSFRFDNTGTRLKHARQQQNMKVADLADRSGVNADTICRIETGHTDQYLSHCIVLAVQLGLSFEELFDGERDGKGLAEAVNRVLAHGGKWTVS